MRTFFSTLLLGVTFATIAQADCSAIRAQCNDKTPVEIDSVYRLLKGCIACEEGCGKTYRRAVEFCAEHGGLDEASVKAGGLSLKNLPTLTKIECPDIQVLCNNGESQIVNRKHHMGKGCVPCEAGDGCAHTMDTAVTYCATRGGIKASK